MKPRVSSDDFFGRVGSPPGKTASNLMPTTSTSSSSSTSASGTAAGGGGGGTSSGSYYGASGAGGTASSGGGYYGQQQHHQPQQQQPQQQQQQQRRAHPPAPPAPAPPAAPTGYAGYGGGAYGTAAAPAPVPAAAPAPPAPAPSQEDWFSGTPTSAAAAAASAAPAAAPAGGVPTQPNAGAAAAAAAAPGYYGMSAPAPPAAAPAQRGNPSDPFGYGGGSGGGGMAGQNGGGAAAAGGFGGSIMQPGAASLSGPMGGSMGAQPSGTGAPTYSYSDDDFDSEPPLMEELGINMDHIATKSRAVVLPFGKYASTHLDASMMVDADLAGPLVFALALGGEMLLAGKVSFGYIYGFGGFGAVALCLVLNLMSPADAISFGTVVSVLGYALLPINALAAINILLRVSKLGILGMILAALTIVWCTTASTRLIENGCGMRDQRYLVAYPVALFYVAFVIITIF